MRKVYSMTISRKLPQIVFRLPRNMHQAGFGRKQEVFRMNEMHAEPPFPKPSGNGYCKHVMTSTAESKRVFKKSHTAH